MKRPPTVRAGRRPAGAALRVGAAPILGLVLASALVLGGVLQLGGAGAERVDRHPGGELWEPAYSRQFPGCVATVLWPVEERPAGLVVRSRSGEVSRLSMPEAIRAARADPGDRDQVIGVCRDD